MSKHCLARLICTVDLTFYGIYSTILNDIKWEKNKDSEQQVDKVDH